MHRLLLLLTSILLSSTMLFGQRAKKERLSYTYIQSPLLKFDSNWKYDVKVIQVNKADLIEKRNAFEERQRIYDETFEKELEAYNNSSVAGRVLLKKPVRKIAAPDFMGAILNEEILSNSAIEIQGLERALSDGEINIEIKLEGFSVVSNEKIVDEKKQRMYYKTMYRNPFTVSVITNNKQLVFSKAFGNELREHHFLDRKYELTSRKLDDEWRANKVSLIAGIEDKTIKNDLAMANEVLNDQIGYPQKTVELELYSAAGKKFDFTESENAIDMLKEAFLIRMSNEDSSNEKLNMAVEIWQTELASKDVEDKKARINKKVATGFYLNLAYVNAIQKKHGEAEKNYLEAEKLRTTWTGPEIDAVKRFIKESKERNP
ncbi:hypothetical protein [Flagellimonas beolgyonensis]|uniref:hypothetical protein n=1 Tax=Flagellimonas beolgyonensis TaxID=864064 RepID=UPI000F8E9A42|nr:hypothetical protein [Allomuricauda beolgyonensis]